MRSTWSICTVVRYVMIKGNEMTALHEQVTQDVSYMRLQGPTMSCINHVDQPFESKHENMW